MMIHRLLIIPVLVLAAPAAVFQAGSLARSPGLTAAFLAQTASENPVAAATQTPVPTATPTPTPAPTATPLPIPTPATPVCSVPAPVAVLAPAPPDNAALEKSVLQFEQDWTTALAKHDVAFLERAEADEYVYTDPAGLVCHKADDLARAKTGEIQIESFSISDEKVRLYGELAIVTGQTTMKGTDKGENITGTYRWTDVFSRRHDNTWQVVASQAAVIQDESD